MRLLNAEQHGHLEAAQLGLTKPGELMSLAGQAVVREFLRHYPFVSEVIVLCGSGNNGGDGWVVAEQLRERNLSVRVLSFAACDELSGDAKIAFERARAEGVEYLEITDFDGYKASLSICKRIADVVFIDALVGSGLNRTLAGLLGEVVEWINEQRAVVVSIDIPSGLNADSCSISGPTVNASLTVAILDARIPHFVRPAARCVGQLEIYHADKPKNYRGEKGGYDPLLDLGCPGPFIELTNAAELNLSYLVRDIDTHKGDCGRVVIVGGSRGKAGAARLAGLAALRAGAGLVTLAVPNECLPHVTHTSDYMTLGLEDADGLATGVGVDAIYDIQPDVIAVGPGLGVGAGPRELLEGILSCRESESRPPLLVLDADALNILATDEDLLDSALETSSFRNPIVITPHPGEFARLRGITVEEIESDRIAAVMSFLAEVHPLSYVHLVLKGSQTLIADPGVDHEGNISINTSGNPGMATGGSGDVLTGVIAAFLAGKKGGAKGYRTYSMGLDRFLVDAVYVHGHAGDLATDKMGQTSVIATDLIDHLGPAIVDLESTDREVASASLSNKWLGELSIEGRSP